MQLNGASKGSQACVRVCLPVLIALWIANKLLICRQIVSLQREAHLCLQRGAITGRGVISYLNVHKRGPHLAGSASVLITTH